MPRAESSPAADRFGDRQMLAYAAPALPIAALTTPFNMYVPPFYATEMGLGLTTVGVVLMAARFWDLITDPMMGVLSDRFPSRWGRRRHWIVLSLLVLLPAVTFVMFPTRIAGGPVGTVYLTASLFVLYIGFTMLTVSHLAWGAELTTDYNERSRFQGFREFANQGGIVLSLSPLLLLEQAGYAESRETLVGAIGLFVLVTLPLSVPVAVSLVGERPAVPGERADFRKSLQVLFTNRFMARILVADFFIALPSAVRGSVYLFYITAIIETPEWSAAILLGYFGASLISVPTWLWIGRRMPKHRAAAIGVLLHVIVSACYLLPGPGDTWLFAALFAGSGLVYAGVPFLLRSMTADVVDYDKLHTGRDRTGLYFSLITTTLKLGGVIGIGVGYPLLDWVGFDPSGPNSPEDLMGPAVRVRVRARGLGAAGGGDAVVVPARRADATRDPGPDRVARRLASGLWLAWVPVGRAALVLAPALGAVPLPVEEPVAGPARRRAAASLVADHVADGVERAPERVGRVELDVPDPLAARLDDAAALPRHEVGPDAVADQVPGDDVVLLRALVHHRVREERIVRRGGSEHVSECELGDRLPLRRPRFRRGRGVPGGGRGLHDRSRTERLSISIRSPFRTSSPVTCIAWSKWRPFQNGATPNGCGLGSMMPSKIISASKRPGSCRVTR